MNPTAKVIGGILVGAALGTVAGLLLAPVSGKKTRGAILKESQKMQKKLKGTIDQATDSFRKKYNARLDELAGNGKQSIDKVSGKVKM